MKINRNEIPSIVALLFIVTAAFLITVLLYPDGKPTISKKTLPAQNGEISVMDTVPSASVWNGEVDSIGIVFDYYKPAIRVAFHDSTGILTIYDPAITVVWDTLEYKQ